MKVIDFNEQKNIAESKEEIELRVLEERNIENQVAYLEELMEKVLEGEVDSLIVISNTFENPPQFDILDAGLEPTHTLLSIESCYEYYKDIFAYPSVFGFHEFDEYEYDE